MELLKISINERARMTSTTNSVFGLGMIPFFNVHISSAIPVHRTDWTGVVITPIEGKRGNSC